MDDGCFAWGKRRMLFARKCAGQESVISRKFWSAVAESEKFFETISCKNTASSPVYGKLRISRISVWRMSSDDFSDSSHSKTVHFWISPRTETRESDFSSRFFSWYDAMSVSFARVKSV